MANTKLTRKYPISDGRLKQMGDSLINTMERDAADFLKRKIGEDERNTLTNMLEAFADMPGDEESKGEWMVATEEKNDLIQQIKVSIRSIRSIVELKYGLRATYRRFGFASLDRLTDEALFRLTRRIVRVGTGLMAELEPKGLSTEMLAELSGLAAGLDNAIEKQHDEAAERQIECEARIIAGNAIWDLMTDFAGVGKSLFVDTDAARYKHYVLKD